MKNVDLSLNGRDGQCAIPLSLILCNVGSGRFSDLMLGSNIKQFDDLLLHADLLSSLTRRCKGRLASASLGDRIQVSCQRRLSEVVKAGKNFFFKRDSLVPF